jgi:branched-chain amino acid transport system permease protein
MEVFGQAMVNGLSIGAIYALLALGLTLLFSIMGVLFFAHGAIYMLGAYIAYYACVRFGLNYFAAIGVALVVPALLGVAIEKGLFRPVRGTLFPPFFIAIGLNWFLENTGFAIFGTRLKSIPTIVPGALRLWGVIITWERLILVLLGLLTVLALQLFLTHTKWGLAMRAFVQDPEAAALQGMSGDSVSSLAFMIGCILAALAGALIAPVYVLSPTMGEHTVLTGMLIISLGGLGSIPGALIAAFVIGLIESFGAMLLGTEFTWAVVFLFVAIFLIVRPAGIMGEHHA